ncbi:cytosine permease [Enterococcus raffinosus]|uniref:Cytosine permease n=1 Tax=Enterococcus raffinosus TaxID=71452 RepID=A0AAW8T885_9ENTE|nr:cytosine permease [Enterococcus raffinosus]MDT2523194.1 cytosine permease [Enterococcus raffinosus]MDT2531019.1 cytosine permease [Enterococcus raffinosus]MDT2533986.1 cytosine permease [Enterococcus raffinosus]MDT2544671.1 cytosine permease [Enterococcus raffinosus]MDT2556788.1 cytosine permease [Enterococcus raffinosus]
MEEVVETNSGNYERERVPEKDRKRWLSISMVWIAIGIDLSGMFMGVALSQGMAFWTAIAAVIIGSIILGLLAIGTTYIGAKAGLSTGMISRISFGKKGASLMGAIMGISSLGWFGVQIGFFAENIGSAISQLTSTTVPSWLLSLIGGGLMMLSAFWGYQAIEKLCTYSVPLLAALIIVATIMSINKNGASGLAIPPQVSTISFGLAVSLVIGVYMVGVVMAPDVARWAQNPKQAMIAGFVGFTIGNSFMIIVSLILVKVMKTADLTAVFFALGLGIPSILVLTLAQWTTNTNNLYSASLDFSIVFKRVNPKVITIICGSLGILMAMFGIYGMFENFLSIVTVLVSPIAGIYMIDYFLYKEKYEFSFEEKLQDYYPVSIISWVIGSTVAFMTSQPPAGFGLFTLTNISALDGIIVAGICYFVLTKLTKGRK